MATTIKIGVDNQTQAGFDEIAKNAENLATSVEKTTEHAHAASDAVAELRQETEKAAQSSSKLPESVADAADPLEDLKARFSQVREEVEQLGQASQSVGQVSQSFTDMSMGAEQATASLGALESEEREAEKSALKLAEGVGISARNFTTFGSKLTGTVVALGAGVTAARAFKSGIEEAAESGNERMNLLNESIEGFGSRMATVGGDIMANFVTTLDGAFPSLADGATSFFNAMTDGIEGVVHPLETLEGLYRSVGEAATDFFSLEAPSDMFQSLQSHVDEVNRLNEVYRDEFIQTQGDVRASINSTIKSIDQMRDRSAEQVRISLITNVDEVQAELDQIDAELRELLTKDLTVKVDFTAEDQQEVTQRIMRLEQQKQKLQKEADDDRQRAVKETAKEEERAEKDRLKAIGERRREEEKAERDRERAIQREEQESMRAEQRIAQERDRLRRAQEAEAEAAARARVQQFQAEVNTVSQELLRLRQQSRQQEQGPDNRGFSQQEIFQEILRRRQQQADQEFVRERLQQVRDSQRQRDDPAEEAARLRDRRRLERDFERNRDRVRRDTMRDANTGNIDNQEVTEATNSLTQRVVEGAQESGQLNERQVAALRETANTLNEQAQQTVQLQDDVEQIRDVVNQVRDQLLNSGRRRAQRGGR